MSPSGKHALADHIAYSVFPRDDVSPFAKHVLIYYIPGNPGFIEYYRNLLDALVLALRRTTSNASSKHKTQYHVHGRNLAGFQLSRPRQSRALSLDDIRRDMIDSIDTEVRLVAKTEGLDPKDISVVLIGHSIGTWLSLEAIVELEKRSPRGSPIAAGILLFPTVFDLAKSPNALRVGRLLDSQYAAFIISILAHILFSLVPLSILTLVISILLGMPQRHALVTASMLKSRKLVEQALYMAHGELLQVTEDRWPDELWGVQKIEGKQLARKSLAAAETSAKTPALFFYWGESDHWVANTTRDAVIAQRARTSTAGDEFKPFMEIDKHGLPHAFTLKDGGADIVADKIVDWLSTVESRP